MFIGIVFSFFFSISISMFDGIAALLSYNSLYVTIFII